MSGEFFQFGASTFDGTPDAELVGRKGANLITMTQLELPVPPGFVIGTDIGQRIANGGDALTAEEREGVSRSIAAIEAQLDRRFGAEKRPLLLSVRSGAPVSMPGMMDTVLNLGLNDKTVLGLAEETGDDRFAWDTYRRFVQMFATVVLDHDPDEFENILEQAREEIGALEDSQLPASSLKEVTKTFIELIEEFDGFDFPQDPNDQLDLCLLAVFNSWNTKRAQRFRDMQGLDSVSGTAAVVQAMVFGNRDERSCSGVYFTRNPSTGENRPYGEYLPKAQGEDVVSGLRTPLELTELDGQSNFSTSVSMEKAFPDEFSELIALGDKLENHFLDSQEIEFTVESGKLFLLQTRSAKRNPNASLRMAVEMVNEGLISRSQAMARCNTDDLVAMLVTRVDPSKAGPSIVSGLPASPGAAAGEVVFTSADAVKAKEQGRECVLVRRETDPKDVHGMDAAVAILTTRGGMTSHAAVVARGMGKPCITAAMKLKIDPTETQASTSQVTLNAGDVITVDGGIGKVFQGRVDIVSPKPDGDLATLLQWKEAL